MQPASSGAVSARKAAITRSKTKETKLRVYSLSELFRLTRAELFALHAQIVAELPALTKTDRDVALNNVRKIRRVLAQPQLRPG
jgi:hypothetical protein